jgi:hypothetical protein
MNTHSRHPENPNWAKSEEFWSGAGGEVDECSVLLRFIDDDLVPDQTSGLLGIQPTLTWRKGEQIAKPRGTYIATTGYWLLERKETTDTADNQITLLLAELTSDMAAWQCLANYRTREIKCCLFLRRWTRGTIFAPQTLQAIADRRLGLHVEIYSRWEYSPYSDPHSEDPPALDTPIFGVFPPAN